MLERVLITSIVAIALLGILINIGSWLGDSLERANQGMQTSKFTEHKNPFSNTFDR